MRVPSGLKPADQMEPALRASTESSSPSLFHSQSVPSLPPVTTRRLSGLKLAEKLPPVM